MFAYIEGTVISKNATSLVIKTQMGLGLRVSVRSTFSVGEFVALHLTHIQKEAASDLYGFENLLDNEFFELLLTVKGVGPKGAMNLMRHQERGTLVESIIAGEAKSISQSKGVGVKMGQNIVFHLQEVLLKQDYAHLREGNVTHFGDVIDSLKALGLKEEQFLPLLKKQQKESMDNPQEMIKWVLRELS